MTPRFRIVICVVSALSILAAEMANAETIEDVVRSLSVRSQSLTTLQVQWQGEGFWSKIDSIAHGEDRIFDSSGKVFFESTGRKRLELNQLQWSETDQAMYPTTLIIADDGSGEKTMFTRGPNGFPHLSEGATRTQSRFRQLRFVPMRLAFWPLDPDLGVCKADLADPRVEETTLDGRRHLIARFGDKQIWVDPSRDLIPVRYYEYREADLKVSAEVEYQEVDGKWQPSAWKTTLHGGDIPRTVYTETVVSLTENQPIEDAVFTLEAPPNSWMTDYSKEGDYLVGSDGGKRLIKPGEYNGTNFQEMLDHHNQRWARFAGVVIVLLLAIGGTIAYLRLELKRP